jgi:nucleoside-diphosphate-sugar epimerase
LAVEEQSMRILFIGGTGNISAAVSRLVVKRGHELSLLNRGTRDTPVEGARSIVADVARTREAAQAIAGRRWDVVVDWIAFTPQDIQRDISLFQDCAEQFVFISSATVYQKPPRSPVITESTPLANPFWDYAQNKIACEAALGAAYRDQGFPVTIVRPSHTYDTVIPTAIGGWEDYGIVQRIKRGMPIVVHGDGTSLWVLTHSEDFAAGFVGLLGEPRAIGHAFHITSEEVLTWNQVYAALGAAAGAEPRVVHIPSEFIAKVEPSLRGNLLGDKANSVIFDNSKIRAFVPDFRAVIPFREGIRRTLDWFEARPERMESRGGSDRVIEKLIAAYGHQ